MHKEIAEGCLRILIIDDDRQTLGALSRLLRLLSHEVQAAATLAEGLARVDGQQVFMSELQLPDGNASELVNKIRAEGRKAKIFIITAADDGQVSRMVDRSKVDGVFRKPVDIVALLSRLRG